MVPVELASKLELKPGQWGMVGRSWGGDIHPEALGPEHLPRDRASEPQIPRFWVGVSIVSESP